MPIDYTEFNKLESDFKRLQDSDINLAFDLRKRSASLGYYFGEQLAEQEKELIRNKKISEGKEAEIMHDYIEKYKVSRGREEYKSDIKLIEVNKDYFDSIELVGKLKALLNFINNIYYISQSISEKGSKNYGKC